MSDQSTMKIGVDEAGRLGSVLPESVRRTLFFSDGVLSFPAQHDAAINAAMAALPSALDIAKASARRAIIARANAFTAPLLTSYPEAERAGWDKREAEARAIIAASDKAAAIEATVIIKSLAQAAGDDEAAKIARAEKIVAKADQFAAISAAVELMRDQSLAAIDAVTDVADMPDVLAQLETQATALAARYGLA